MRNQDKSTSKSMEKHLRCRSHKTEKDGNSRPPMVNSKTIIAYSATASES